MATVEVRFAGSQSSPTDYGATQWGRTGDDYYRVHGSRDELSGVLNRALYANDLNDYAWLPIPPGV